MAAASKQGMQLLHNLSDTVKTLWFRTGFRVLWCDRRLKRPHQMVHALAAPL